MQTFSGALQSDRRQCRVRCWHRALHDAHLIGDRTCGRGGAEEDRTYLDRPPIGFRLVWWPIQWIAYYLGRLIPASRRQAALIKLRKAGLDYTLSPEQYIAGRIVAALLAGALAAWLADSFLATEVVRSERGCVRLSVPSDLAEGSHRRAQTVAPEAAAVLSRHHHAVRRSRFEPGRRVRASDAARPSRPITRRNRPHPARRARRQVTHRCAAHLPSA